MIASSFFRHAHFMFALIAALTVGPRGYAAFLAFGAVLLWACWPALAMAANPAPPFLVLGLAATVGYILSLSLAVSQGRARPFFATRWSTLAFVAIALLLNNILFLTAMPKIGAAETNVISYLWPVLFVSIMAVVKREKLGVVRFFGIALGFVGAAAAIGPTFEHGFDLMGALFAFLSGLTFAVYAAVRSFARDGQDVIGPSMGPIAVIAILMHFAFENFATLSLIQMAAIAGIGIAPLTLSNALWDRATRTQYTSMISSIAFLTPLGALLILAVFGIATVSQGALLGAIAVVLGAIAASGLLSRTR